MEQDINTASVGDIYVEQAVAEMEVAYAIATSYIKDAMFVEYLAEMNGVDIYQEGFFAEADDNGEKTPFKEKLKNAGAKIKATPGKVWRFLKSVVSAIATSLTNFWKFLTEKSLKACVKKLRELPNESGETYPLPVWANVNSLNQIIGATDNFVSAVEELIDNKAYTFEFDWVSVLDDTTHRDESLSASELLEMFEKLLAADVANKIKGAVKKCKDAIKLLDKQINEESKAELKAADNKDAKKAIKDVRSASHAITKEAMATVKKDGISIMNGYTKLMREYRRVANVVLKTEKKDYKNTLKDAKKNPALAPA